MSAGMRNGLLLAVIQVTLVLSLGGKLLYDRATRPRVWVRAQYFDPDLPIRGRYLSARLEMPAEGFLFKQPPLSAQNNWYMNRDWAYFELRTNQLRASPQGSGPGGWAHLQMQNGQAVAQLEQPVLIFISERASVPRLQQGDEMWVEVTLPAKGFPRPLRVGIEREGILKPLKLN